MSAAAQASDAPLPSRPQHRYVVHPGPVASDEDGRWHHVSALQLLGLYRVPPGSLWVDASAASRVVYTELDTHLFPRTDGDYRMPSPEVSRAILAAHMEWARAKSYPFRRKRIGRAANPSGGRHG